MPTLKLPSVCRSKLDTPQTDRLIANRDALLCQQVYDVTKAQVEAVVDPYHIANDAGVKAMSFVGTRGQIISAVEVPKPAN